LYATVLPDLIGVGPDLGTLVRRERQMSDKGAPVDETETEVDATGNG